MPEQKMPNLEEGKLIKDIDFQILVCQEKIENHRKSIEKIKRMSGMNGPSGIGGIDYTGMPRAGFSHMDFPDALASIARNAECIEQEKESIKSLRKSKKNLIKAAKALDGLEQQIFVRRVIFALTQDIAADEIGISRRQLQRVESQMRKAGRIFGL